MARRQMPDIMAEMMSESKVVKHENNKTINIEEKKERTTFNLSLETIQELEEMWMLLRKEFKNKGRITKTLLVEQAISQAVQQLKEKGIQSSFVKKVSDSL